MTSTSTESTTTGTSVTRPPTLAQLCRLYVDGWSYIEAHAPASDFAPGDRERIAFLKALVDPAAGRITSLEALMSAVQLGGNMSVSNFGYLPIAPMTDTDPMSLGQTCFRFGAGRLGWYFAKASGDHWGFSWILFRTEIAPPAVVAAAGIAPSAAVLYSLTGGSGTNHDRDGKTNKKRRRWGTARARASGSAWHSVPPNVFQGTFVCHGGGDRPGFAIRFDSDNDCQVQHDRYIVGIPSFSRVTCRGSPVRCGITIQADGHIALWARYPSERHVATTTTRLARGRPRSRMETHEIVFNCRLEPTGTSSAVYNGPGGCLPCAPDGSGSSYWSLTDMCGFAQFAERVDQTKRLLHEHVATCKVAHGWFDHQWIHASSAPAPTPGLVTRWLWLPMQLDNGHQYMISVIFAPNDLSLEHGVTRGATYASTFVNAYVPTREASAAASAGTTPIFGKTSATVTILDTIDYRGSTFPTQVHIALEVPELQSTRHLLLATFFGCAQAIVFLPSGVWNWEGPADLYDIGKLVRNSRTRVQGPLELEGLERIGSGFLEANQMVSAKQIVQTQATALVKHQLLTAEELASLFFPSSTSTAPVAAADNRTKTRERPFRAAAQAQVKSAAHGSFVGVEQILVGMLLLLALVLIVFGAWWAIQRIPSKQRDVAATAATAAAAASSWQYLEEPAVLTHVDPADADNVAL